MSVGRSLPKRVGIIDLGSNSARLIVAHYAPGRIYQITDEVSRRVRLSEGLLQDGTPRLQPAAMRRALEALRMFTAFCAHNGIRRIIPVATAAVREAANRREFLAQVRRETHLRLRVVSGEEEARLGAIGVINGLGLRAGLVMDVGGGSAEVSAVRAGHFVRGVTAPLGAVRLTELHLHSDPARRADVARLEAHIAGAFQMIEWMNLRRGDRFVAVGGTARTLARMDLEARRYPLQTVNSYELERRRLDRMIERLRALPAAARPRRFPGLQPDRADIILAGAMVVAGAMRRAGAESVLVSGLGLREGLFFREFLRPADPPFIRNLREFSVLNLARLYSYEQEHADQVTRLALSLFDQLARKHGYGARERELLWAAGQLHDIGMAVEYYNHHQHSAYLILSTGLPGYSHRELALVALLCLYHRKGEPTVEPYAELLRRGDAARVRRLAALLRLAEYLDRSRAQLVTGVRIRLRGKQARLTVRARTEARARVEVWEAQRNADLFETAFGCKLEIEAG